MAARHAHMPNSDTWQRHVTQPGIVTLPRGSVRVSSCSQTAAYAAACMRVFKLAKSGSGTSFAVLAALSAAFS